MKLKSITEAQYAKGKITSLKQLVRTFFKNPVKEKFNDVVVMVYYLKDGFVIESEHDDGVILGFGVDKEGQVLLRYEESIHSGSDFEYSDKEEVFNLSIYQRRQVN